MTMENRKHKDSLFIDLFCKDKVEGKENFISLYNALHQSKLDLASTELKEVNIENVLYTVRSNDIAMLVDDRLVVLLEHQSTINENMPLRLLEYVSRVYEQLIPIRTRYKKKAMKLPYPEFYVFYDGKNSYPAEKTLKLSDAFIIPEKKYLKKKNISLEILVKVININIGANNSILKHCKTLEEYSTLVELVRESKQENPDSSLEETLTKAIKNGILSEYLQRKSSEVRNMLIAEYSYETDIEVQREEAFEEGAEQTKIQTAKNMIIDKIPLEQIAKWTALPLEKIEQIKNEYSKSQN
ncbi:MAG: hypothetical protein E7060_07280 [Treponema bryantii]|nr:hypothetical protein [Treponema bryantii]